MTLRPTAFRGDQDAAELLAFFAPERQFDGDVRWSFGTSLKSAYVNTYEFLNHAPIVQLWRDAGDLVQAVSRISLGTGEWFYQAAPGFRTDAVTASIVAQADQAFDLLSDQSAWHTVAYESDLAGIERLKDRGYEPRQRDEVFMEMPLDSIASRKAHFDAVEVRLLDAENAGEVRERALTQVDAFGGGAPSESEQAWIHRTLPHQLAYAPDQSANVVAIADDGSCLAFADVYFDPVSLVGEFEPVGTRTDAQQQGLASAVMRHGLGEMRSAGMTRAIVRTGVDNAPALAAYESVGFKITDYRIRFRWKR